MHKHHSPRVGILIFNFHITYFLISAIIHKNNGNICLKNSYGLHRNDLKKLLEQIGRRTMLKVQFLSKKVDFGIATYSFWGILLIFQLSWFSTQKSHLNPNSPKIKKLKNQEIFDLGGIRVQRVNVQVRKNRWVWIIFERRLTDMMWKFDVNLNNESLWEIFCYPSPNSNICRHVNWAFVARFIRFCLRNRRTTRWIGHERFSCYDKFLFCLRQKLQK